jgi:hypothetical protein
VECLRYLYDVTRIFVVSVGRLVLVKHKTIPVIGRGGLWDCKMSNIPHCLDSRLTGGGKLSVVSLTHRPRSTPQKHYFSASGTYFG